MGIAGSFMANVYLDYYFLNTSMKIPLKERVRVALAAVDMYSKKETERKIEGPMYEGLITTDGRYVFLGGFGGQHFKVEIDTDKGADTLEFIVAEKINPNLN